MKSPRQWPARLIRSGGLGQSGLALLGFVRLVCGIRDLPQAKRACILTALPTGQWGVVLPSGESVSACLQHIWPSFAWITLAFSIPSSSALGSSVRLTVWKHRLSATEWQALRVITARQAAMPDRAVYKGSP